MRMSNWLIVLVALALAKESGGVRAAELVPNRFPVDVVYATSLNRTVQEHVGEFVSLLNERLANSLAWGRIKGLTDASHITVVSQGFASLPSPAEIEQRWRNRQAIQIVVGHGEQTPNGTAFQGNIFLGGLNGRLPEAILFRQTINGAELESGNDLVLVVTLYALSVDTRRHPAVSCQLLSQAGVLIRSVPSSQLSAGAVRSAVSADLHAFCAGTPR